MEDASLEQGFVIGVQWQLRQRLGEAPAGRVWEAEHVQTRARVAIKFLPPPPTTDAGARRRFEREVRSMSKVRSAYVVQIIDHGHTESGRPFIVMELLSGQDLARFLRQERVLGLRDVARMFDHLCRGLAKVHAAGLARCSLEPEHVFLMSESEGRPGLKLLAFGFPQGAGTQSEREVGALGRLIYRMLSGGWPSAGDSRVSERRPELPAALDDWFARALGAGYRSVEEARADFERILRGAVEEQKPEPPVIASAGSIVVRPSPKAASGWQVAWCAAAGVLVAIGLSAFTLRGMLPDMICGRSCAEARETSPTWPAAPVAASARTPPPATLGPLELSAPEPSSVAVQPPDAVKPARHSKVDRRPVPTVPTRAESSEDKLTYKPVLPAVTHVYRGF